jgi:Ca2+-binding RTX toxin-like protein
MRARFVRLSIPLAVAAGVLAVGFSTAGAITPGTVLCDGIAADKVGTNAADVIALIYLGPADYNAVVATQGGADTVRNADDGDTVCLGKGNDTANAFQDPAPLNNVSLKILGDNGDDTINISIIAGPAVGFTSGDFEGGPGNDTIIGGTGEFFGDENADTIKAGSSEEHDVLHGGKGPDELHGDLTDNGSGGNDEIHGGPNNDEMFGGGGNDTLDGNGGSDFADGGPGTDTCHAEVEVNCELN